MTTSPSASSPHSRLEPADTPHHSDAQQDPSEGQGSASFSPAETDASVAASETSAPSAASPSPVRGETPVSSPSPADVPTTVLSPAELDEVTVQMDSRPCAAPRSGESAPEAAPLFAAPHENDPHETDPLDRVWSGSTRTPGSTAARPPVTPSQSEVRPESGESPALSPRPGTLVWGVLLLGLGLTLIGLSCGITIDPAVASIVILGIAGVALLGMGVYHALAKK